MSRQNADDPSPATAPKAGPARLDDPAIDPEIFRLFADNLPTLCWIANADGYITWYSRSWHEYCGTTAAEMEGWGWQKVHDPQVLPRVMEHWAACIAEGRFFEMTFPLRSATGEFRCFLTRIKPLLSASGEVIRWFGVNTDIQNQIDAEAALRELAGSLEREVEERTRELSQTWQVSPDLLGVWSRQGGFEKTNPAWQMTLGWSAAELAATTFFDGIHADDVAVTRAAWAAIDQGQPVLRFEARYRHRQGGWRWLSWVLVPEGDKFYGSARDITVKKEQAAALARSTADRDRMWRLATDVMMIADFESAIRAVNPAWSAIMGWSGPEMIGRRFLELVHPDDLAATGREIGRLGDGAATLGFENRLRRKDGSYCMLAWTAVPDAGFIHAVGRDVTAERDAQAELAAAQDALRQSQKMDAVGQLTGGIAHDFNNLLTGISGSLERMQSRIAQGRIGEIGRYVNAAQGAAERAAALTHRLLAFSRRQTLDPKPVNVNRLIGDMEDMIRRAIGPQIGLEVVGAAGLWPTLADPNQLENALLNLCINARDAMPDGGLITIETANKWLDDQTGKERDLPAGQYVSLSVTDTGTGMTPEVIARAFEPFFTTKPLGAGTGLGLSMIYGFVRQSDGQIRVYSELGGGTTMTLYLPRHTGAAATAEAFSRPFEAAAAGGGKTVLVVDDEPTVRMLIVEVLEDCGFHAIEAGDGQAGLQVLQSGGRVDLLITDVGLPGGMNGRQMADAARALRPELKVLFITGYAENAVVRNGHLDAGMEILTKPFAMDALSAKITAVLGRDDDRSRADCGE